MSVDTSREAVERLAAHLLDGAERAAFNGVPHCYDAAATLRALLAERAGWQDAAAMHLRNEEWMRELLENIGSFFGVAARTADDGSVYDSVLLLRVPELVATSLAERDAAITENLENIEAASQAIAEQLRKTIAAEAQRDAAAVMLRAARAKALDEINAVRAANEKLIDRCVAARAAALEEAALLVERVRIAGTLPIAAAIRALAQAPQPDAALARDFAAWVEDER